MVACVVGWVVGGCGGWCGGGLVGAGWGGVVGLVWGWGLGGALGAGLWSRRLRGCCRGWGACRAASGGGVSCGWCCGCVAAAVVWVGVAGVRWGVGAWGCAGGVRRVRVGGREGRGRFVAGRVGRPGECGGGGWGVAVAAGRRGRCWRREGWLDVGLVVSRGQREPFAGRADIWSDDLPSVRGARCAGQSAANEARDRKESKDWVKDRAQFHLDSFISLARKGREGSLCWQEGENVPARYFYRRKVGAPR